MRLAFGPLLLKLVFSRRVRFESLVFSPPFGWVLRRLMLILWNILCRQLAKEIKSTCGVINCVG